MPVFLDFLITCAAVIGFLALRFLASAVFGFFILTDAFTFGGFDGFGGFGGFALSVTLVDSLVVVFLPFSRETVVVTASAVAVALLSLRVSSSGVLSGLFKDIQAKGVEAVLAEGAEALAAKTNADEEADTAEAAEENAADDSENV